MSDATPLPLGPDHLPVGVEKKDAMVSVADIDAHLLSLLAILGRVHLALFNKVLVITSGNDGQHARGSLHYRNLAVDLRATDKTPMELLLFLDMLAYLAETWKLGVYYERGPGDVYHFHVERVE